MSQAKLTLRPPPNVDFVQGYPGIPPGPDRPQAAVKGAIEVRVGPGGVKAKWVRIELRKVETLPGGGLANTFFDFVGQSPVNLWQSGEEYSLLTTQDFQFSIRIPESIPPSIALEKGAGIKYELIATLCIKGKKGFLRRDKHIIVSTSAPIIIDKHELHSTWPVYSQPETRNTAMDGMTLFVERTNTCYGPGDRMAVMAVVRSESPQTIVLRGFEFSLRETTVFRAGPNTVGKKAAPQVKTGNVTEQKVPVNQTLYTGMQHRAELAITVPSNHTSTTLNAARHIDITYVLTVRALLATGKPLVMDLPIIISNWPRSVSVEAVRRIGLAPNVQSHTPAHMGQQPVVGGQIMTPPGRTPGNHPYLNPAPTVVTESSSEATESRTNGNYGTAPGGYDRKVDEFGIRTRGASIDQGPQTIGGAPAPSGGTGSVAARPRSSGRGMAPAGNRLTVTNFGEDMPEEVRNQNLQQLAAGHRRNTSGSARTPRGFMNAEEEKRMLYERAKAQVEQVQGVARTQSPPIEVLSPTPVRDAGPILSAANSSVSARPSGKAWPSAEDEKARLFNQAKEAVRKTQGVVDEPEGMSSTSALTPNNHGRSGSVNSGSPSSMSTGAAMYSQALSSVGRNASAGHSTATAASSGSTKRSYLTAEEEKATLRRYQEATAAVQRSQTAAYGTMPSMPEHPSPESPPPMASPVASPKPNPPPQNPIPYDALYPNSARMASPPPAGGSQQAQPSYMTEKEKLRRMYEAQDAAAQQQQAASPPPPPPMDAPAYMPPASPMPYTNGGSSLSEKELLRRRYEAQDAAALASAPPPSTPPRVASSHGRSLPTPRAQPTPPPGPSGSRPLTAGEEKARLRAMYEAEERGMPPPQVYSPSPMHAPVNGMNGHNGVNGHGTAVGMERQMSVSSGRSQYSDIPPPPPLMPKPPKEYMEETLQEDRVLSTQIHAMDKQHDESYFPRVDANLDLRPFTPFHTGFEAQAIPLSIPPPPPLPPKIGLDDP